MTAEERRQPVAVGVAAHTHEPSRDVELLSPPPVLQLCQTAARAVLQVQLKRPRVQRLPVEVLGEVILVHAELAALSAEDERARVLRHAGLLDRVDDLERILNDDRSAER